MPLKQLDFYFDYLSPYAFFGWLNVQAICDARDIALNAHPLLFAGLLNHWGQLGPAEIPPKRIHTAKTNMRYAALHGIEYTSPPSHPFNPLFALRLSLQAVSGDRQKDVINALFKACWSDGRDLGNPEELQSILVEKYLPADTLLAAASQQTAKDQLKQNTQAAIDRGVFGIPTVIVGDEVFWGNDQMEYVKLFLDGKDPLDQEKFKRIANAPRAADRPELLQRIKS